MNKYTFIIISILLINSNLYSEEKKCVDLEGARTINKESAEYLKCIADKIKANSKLNTNSTIGDAIAREKKFKIPNPISGLKKFANDTKEFQEKKWNKSKEK